MHSRDFLTRQRDTDSDCALIFGGRFYSAALINEAAERLAAFMSRAGVMTCHRIGLRLGNGPTFFCALLAVLKLRASAVLLSTHYTKYEVENYIAGTGLRALLSEAQSDSLSRNLVARCDLSEDKLLSAIARTKLSWLETDGTGQERVDVPPDWRDKEFTLQFTSGVSGQAKIIPRSYANVAEELSSFAQTININEQDVVLCLAPLSHTYGLVNGFLMPFFSGARVILLDWFLPNDVVELVRRHRPTILVGVPFMYKMLAETYGAQAEDFSSLRICFSAGARLPRDTSDGFMRRYGLRINQQYGSTETGAIAVNLFADGFADDSSVGQPIRGRCLRIVDERGNEVEHGRTGEIAVFSPAATRGYLHLDELNRRNFRAGWYMTGDIGHVDVSGNLYITGRRTAFINVAGFKVDPAEVEGVLATHPRIRDCAVVRFYSRSGEQESVKAYIVGDAALSPAEIISYCKERLASYKVPRHIEFLDQLPRSATGKVLLKYLMGEVPASAPAPQMP